MEDVRPDNYLDDDIAPLIGAAPQLDEKRHRLRSAAGPFLLEWSATRKLSQPLAAPPLMSAVTWPDRRLLGETITPLTVVGVGEANHRLPARTRPRLPLSPPAPGAPRAGGASAGRCRPLLSPPTLPARQTSRSPPLPTPHLIETKQQRLLGRSSLLHGQRPL